MNSQVGVVLAFFGVRGRGEIGGEGYYIIYYYQYITRKSFMLFGANEGGVVNSQIGVKGGEKSGSDGQNQGVRCSKVGCKL